MLRRIYRKLFIAILGTNALLALLMYGGVSWSFDREFREHLGRQELARLGPVAATLVQGYGQHGGWAWIVDDPQRWSDLLHRYLAPARADTGAAEATTADASPRGSDTITFSPRLLLLDAGQQALIGPAALVPRAVLQPLAWQGQTVGYLGYLPRKDLVQTLDQLFAERQRGSFAVITAGMLLTAALLAAGIARWISRPVQQLASGTQALARGDYQVRVQVSGNDEFAQLAHDFNALGDALLSGRRSREQWIADTSHELRTPLAVLRAEIEALQDGVRKPSPETLASLSQEVAKLSRLVEDLQVLSRSDLGVLEFRMAPLDLSRLVQEELEGCRDMLAAAGLDLQLALAPQAPLRGDATRMVQLLDNLKQNTLRYTDMPGRLRVSTRMEEGRLLLEWEDSAPGVPEQDLPRLTDRLYRVESSRSRASGGSGLGLAIARAIVEAHGGRMLAGASSLGGLAWRIEFPA